MTPAIAIVGTREDHEFGARGKLTQAHFLAPFRQALAARGVSSVLARYDEMATLDPAVDAAILVYAEVRAQIVPETGRILDRAVEAARARGIHVIHPTSLGRLVADKALTNDMLTAAGVPMPRRIVAATGAPCPVFSNAVMSSQAETAVLPVGAPLDPGRYNTEWIDTRHDFDGSRYFVSLRLIAVGRRRVATLIRARPANQGNPSVHDRNTPLDPALLNHLHRELVRPRGAALDALCERIGDALGLGFYAHDLLVESGTGRLLLCETGFKLQDETYRMHIAPIRDALDFDDGLTEAFAARSADCFADELPRALAVARTTPDRSPYSPPLA